MSSIIQDMAINEFRLDTDRFAETLKDPTQCYKFYWLDAIIYLTSIQDGDLSFDEIINEMIYKAWWTVITFHLRLGPTIQGNTINFLERAIKKIEDHVPSYADRNIILQAIKDNSELISEEKNNIAKYVPYRLLSSFLDISGSDILWDQRKRLIAYINELNKNKKILYTIIDNSGLEKKIRIDPEWRMFILANIDIIQSWIQYKKVQYLQSRNPAVPGIIYKLSNDVISMRKLSKARDLWKSACVVSQEGLVDIYSGKRLDDKFELDHFIPWTFIANDELWNLTPTSKQNNASKSNKLPNWEKYFGPLSHNQFCLCRTIYKYEEIYKKFMACQTDNVNTIWAIESLYIQDITEDQFVNIMEQNMQPIYNAAKIQGFREWVPLQ